MPVAGIPRVALVMARLIVRNEDYGVHPLVVALSDRENMGKGVTSA